MSNTTTETEATAETEATETPQEAQQEHPEHVEADEATEGQDHDGKASREAAKYRRQLRETETQRDELAGQIKTMRTAIAEEALGGVLAKPASLWMTGIDAAEFYDTAGNLDTEALTTAAQQAVKEHGLQPHRRFGGSADNGVRESTETPRRFSDMFKPAS